MPIINMKEVTVQYGKNVVIDRLSLRVDRGENLAIVGPTSCGKTTLMRALCGFVKITHGEITIRDVVASSFKKRIMVAPENRRIGVVFQDYAVWPHLTVIENIVYPLKKRRVPKTEARQRALEALAKVKMADFSDRLPSQLSGGQQQRVALARALVSSSDIIMLDEPITNLDAKLREEMAYEIKSLQRSIGITVLYITHDQNTAMTISDRMVIMDRSGGIRQIGSPEQIWNNPKDKYVYEFLGVSNFLPVTYDSGRLLLAGHASPGGQVMTYAGANQLERRGDLLLASRPVDIRLSPLDKGPPTTFTGEIQRVTYLGDQFDYIVNVGGHPIRVQQDSLEAFREGVHEEGSIRKVEFLNPSLYPADDAASAG